MRRLTCLLGVVIGALVMSSCGPPTSKAPLSTRADSMVDTELLGSWQDIRDTSISIEFGVTDSPVIDARVVEARAEGDAKVEHYKMLLTRIGKMNCLSITAVQPDEIAGWTRTADGDFFLGKYEISNHRARLKIFLMDEDHIDGAIRKGQLKGESTVTSHPDCTVSKSVRIDDSPEALHDYILRADHKKLFGLYAEYQKKGK